MKQKQCFSLRLQRQSECYHFPFLYAPVNKGDKIGKIIIKYQEKEVISVPLVAEESVEYYAKQE